MIATITRFLHLKGYRSSTGAVVGWVDGVHRGQIRGWALDPAAPTSRLIVEAVGEKGQLIARVLADRYRADVHKAGYGDGHHGFAVRFDDLIAPGKARFLCRRSNIELPGELRCAVSVPGKHGTRTIERAGYFLHLDRLPGGSCLTGWAVDRRSPDERRQLRLRAGRRPLAVQRATLFRPDSIERNSDGFHGFSLPLPSDTGGLYVDDMASGLEFRIS